MKDGSFVDKRIIQLQMFYQGKTKGYNLLTDEVSIDGKSVRFASFPLFNGAVRALVPDDFTEMPRQYAEVRYMIQFRPPVILTNPDFDVNFGYHFLKREEAGETTGLDGLIRRMQDAVALHAPETVFYGDGNLISGGLEGRWFEYKNFTIGEETYHLQFLVGSGVHLLAGTFNCRMCVYDEWRGPVLKSLECLEIDGERGAGR